MVAQDEVYMLQSKPIKQPTGGLHYEHYPELFPTLQSLTVDILFGFFAIITVDIYIFLFL